MKTEMSVNEQAVQMLKGALKIMNKGENWHKGSYSNDEGDKFCSIGAVNEMRRKLGYESEYCDLESEEANHNPRAVAVNALRRFAKVISNGTTASASQFNDLPETTFEDVEVMFRKAIAYLGG